MPEFDVSKKWAILVPPDATCINKAAGDLSRYLGLLAHRRGAPKPAAASPAEAAPLVVDGTGDAPQCPIIVLNDGGGDSEKNGFSWRAGDERVEIFGESGRGLCNGIYSFLSALGISWPFPGQEMLPSPVAAVPVGANHDPVNVNPGLPLIYGLANNRAYESSRNKEVGSSLRRFFPAGKKTVKYILRNAEAFAAWAARRRYDAVIIPLSAFSSEKSRKKIRLFGKFAGEYGIALEAGGRELSSLVPRKNYFLHRDYFRMAEGKRKREHHFCPTNPGSIKLVGREAEKIFRSAGEAKIFHLWPDRGAETIWCSCPSCRAFSPQEQNRIAVNTAADVLAPINPSARISFYEQSDEGVNIPLRKNLTRMERLPEEKELRNGGEN